MIQSIKGKLAASAMKGKYGKGFPGDLVKRTRAMLTASRIYAFHPATTWRN
jgi:proteic killer suppression protein